MGQVIRGVGGHTWLNSDKKEELVRLAWRTPGQTLRMVAMIPNRAENQVLISIVKIWLFLDEIVTDVGHSRVFLIA
jgi:hypothetical protein